MTNWRLQLPKPTFSLSCCHRGPNSDLPAIRRLLPGGGLAWAGISEADVRKERGYTQREQFLVFFTGRGGLSNGSTGGVWLHVFTPQQNLRGSHHRVARGAWRHSLALRSADMRCLEPMCEMRGGGGGGGSAWRTQGEGRTRGTLPTWMAAGERASTVDNLCTFKGIQVNALVVSPM